MTGDRSGRGGAADREVGIRGRPHARFFERTSATSAIGGIERSNDAAVVVQRDSRGGAGGGGVQGSGRGRGAQKLAVCGVAEGGVAVPAARRNEERPGDDGLRFQALQPGTRRALGCDDRGNGRFQVHGHHGHEFPALLEHVEPSAIGALDASGHSQQEPRSGERRRAGYAHAGSAAHNLEFVWMEEPKDRHAYLGSVCDYR